METIENLESQLDPNRLGIQSNSDLTSFNDPTQE